MRLARRLLIGVALVTSTTLASGSAAWSDPVKGRNAVTFPATCDGRQVVFVLTGGGEWTPAHVVGTNEVFHPTAFDISRTFTPPGGAPEEFELEATRQGQRKGVQDELVTCSFSISETDEEGTFTAVGTATGFFSPPGGRSA